MSTNGSKTDHEQTGRGQTGGQLSTELPSAEGPAGLGALWVGGVEVNYFFICKRKLWWYTHGLGMEHTSDLVSMGSFVHEESYPRKKKEYLIDSLVRIDFVDEGEIHEVKLSQAAEKAHRYQLLYYLYFLKHRGVKVQRGYLNFPKSKRVVEVALVPEEEARIEEILQEIQAIRRQSSPPLATHTKFCRSCSYEELCWS